MWGIKKKASAMFKSIAFMAAMAFIVALVGADMMRAKTSYASLLNLPAPDQILSMSKAYSMPALKGIKFDPLNPLNVSFFIDPGTKGMMKQEDAAKLIRYFLASLTIPEEDVWVNLSPYENDRIVNDNLAVTDMGRDLLAQDYILKQLSSSLTHPETTIGKDYWESTYQSLMAQNGSTAMPVNTFNKIWIMPKTAEVYEENGLALVTKAKLTAMLEEDYMALANNVSDIQNDDYISEDKIEELSSTTSEMMKKYVLPKVIQDVNEGKNFAQLRQIYHAQILAAWFKNKFEDSFYANYINGEKTGGIDTIESVEKEKIFSLYVDAFKKGVYDYVKKEYDPQSKQKVKRRYFSGGYQSSAIRSDLAEGSRADAMQDFNSNKVYYHVVSEAMDSEGNDLKSKMASSIMVKAVSTVALLATMALAQGQQIIDTVSQTRDDHAHVTNVIERSSNPADQATFTGTQRVLARNNMIGEVASAQSQDINVPTDVSPYADWDKPLEVANAYDSLARVETNDDVKAWYQDAATYFRKVARFVQARGIEVTREESALNRNMDRVFLGNYLSRQALSQPVLDSMLLVDNFQTLLDTDGAVLDGQAAQDSAATLIGQYKAYVDSLGMAENGVTDSSVVDPNLIELQNEKAGLIRDTLSWTATLADPATDSLISQLAADTLAFHNIIIDTNSTQMDVEIAQEEKGYVMEVLQPYIDMEANLIRARERLIEIALLIGENKIEINDPDYYQNMLNGLYEAIMILSVANKTDISFDEYLNNIADREARMKAEALARNIGRERQATIDLSLSILANGRERLEDVLSIYQEGLALHQRGDSLNLANENQLRNYAESRLRQHLVPNPSGFETEATVTDMGVNTDVMYNINRSTSDIHNNKQGGVSVGLNSNWGKSLADASYLLGVMDFNNYGLYQNHAYEWSVKIRGGGGFYDSENNVESNFLSANANRLGEVAANHPFASLGIEGRYNSLRNLNANTSMQIAVMNSLLARLGTTGDNESRTNGNELVNLTAAQFNLMFNDGRVGPFVNFSSLYDRGTTEVEVGGTKVSFEESAFTPALEAGVWMNINDIRARLAYLERLNNANRGLSATFQINNFDNFDWQVGYMLDFDQLESTVGTDITLRPGNRRTLSLNLGTEISFTELLSQGVNSWKSNIALVGENGTSIFGSVDIRDGNTQLAGGVRWNINRQEASDRLPRASRARVSANNEVISQFRAVNDITVDTSMTQNELIETYADQPAFLYADGSTLHSMTGQEFMQAIEDGDLWAAGYNYDLSNASLALDVDSSGFEVVKTENNSRQINKGGAAILANMYSTHNVIHQSMPNNKYRLEFVTDTEFYDRMSANNPVNISRAEDIAQGKMTFTISEQVNGQTVTSNLHVMLSDSAQTMVRDLLNSTPTDVKLTDSYTNQPVVGLLTTREGTDLVPVTADALSNYQFAREGSNIPGLNRVVQQGEYFYSLGNGQYARAIVNPALIDSANINYASNTVTGELGVISTPEYTVQDINEKGEVVDTGSVTVDTSNVISNDQILANKINAMTPAAILAAGSSGRFSAPVRQILGFDQKITNEQGVEVDNPYYVDSTNASAQDVNTGSLTFYNDIAVVELENDVNLLLLLENGQVTKSFKTKMDYDIHSQTFKDLDGNEINKVDSNRVPLRAPDIFEQIPSMSSATNADWNTGGIDFNSVRSMVKTAAGSSSIELPKLDMAGLNGLSLAIQEFNQITGDKVFAFAN